jgi:hypothetical protein
VTKASGVSYFSLIGNTGLENASVYSSLAGTMDGRLTRLIKSAVRRQENSVFVLKLGDVVSLLAKSSIFYQLYIVKNALGSARKRF